MRDMNINCANCGTELDRPPCRIKANPTQFCNHACHTDYQRRNRVEVACVICGTVKVVAPSHAARTESPVCSRACESERIRRMRIDYFGTAETRVATCAQCGVTFERKPSQLTKYGAAFCSRACLANHKWHGQRPRYAPGWTPKLKARIRQRDGNACRSCGLPWRPKSGNLVVHHIDEQRVDHDDANLITLCRSCHLKVHEGAVALPSLTPATV